MSSGLAMPSDSPSAVSHLGVVNRTVDVLVVTGRTVDDVAVDIASVVAVKIND